MGLDATKYDKPTILALFKTKVEEAKTEAEAQRQKYIDDSIGQNGVTHSRGGTIAFQDQIKEDNVRRKLDRLYGELVLLNALLLTNWGDGVKSSKIGLLSVVKIVNELDDNRVIFIMPGETSGTINYSPGQDNSGVVEITVVSIMTAMAKALLGKTVDDIVTIGTHQHKITFSG